LKFEVSPIANRSSTFSRAMQAKTPMIAQTRDMFTLFLTEHGGRLTKEAVDRLERSCHAIYISSTGSCVRAWHT